MKDAHEHFPSYNCSVKYIKRANRARHFHDLTCATLIFACNSVAIGVYHAISHSAGRSGLIFNLLIGVVALLCVIANLLLPKLHYKVEEK